MFSAESSRVLSERYVTVRITGGDETTPETGDFVTRYAVRGYPTLYVMNAAGHVVVNQVGRTLQAMLLALETGAARETEFAALADKTDPESRVKRATMLGERMLLDEAQAAFRALIAEAPSAAAHEGLAKLYAQRGERAKERKLLGEMIALYPRADAHTSWRIRLATMGLDHVKSRDEWRENLTSVVETLEALAVHLAAQKTADVLPRAEVRTQLGNFLSMAGRNDDARAHLEWVLEHAADSRFAPAARMGKANVNWRQGDFAGCKNELETLLREHPASEEAKRAPRGIKNCDARLGR